MYLYILLVSLFLGGCALLTPPKEEELLARLRDEPEFKGKVIPQDFRKNPFENKIEGRFIICSEANRQIWVWAELDGFGRFKVRVSSPTGVPCGITASPIFPESKIREETL